MFKLGFRLQYCERRAGSGHTLPETSWVQVLPGCDEIRHVPGRDRPVWHGLQYLHSHRLSTRESSSLDWSHTSL